MRHFLWAPAAGALRSRSTRGSGPEQDPSSAPPSPSVQCRAAGRKLLSVSSRNTTSRWFSTDTFPSHTRLRALRFLDVVIPRDLVIPHRQSARMRQRGPCDRRTAPHTPQLGVTSRRTGMAAGSLHFLPAVFLAQNIKMGTSEAYLK